MRLLLPLLLLAVVCTSGAEPFVPEDDAQILQRLPERRDTAIALQRRAWRAAPANAEVATAFARRAIDAYRGSGDPRYLGEARAAFKPWDAQADVPLPVLLLRATVRQSLHDFVGALADLDRVLALAPRDAQARITRATVRNVIGRHVDAMADCDALTGLAAPLVVAACRADTAGRAGRAREALTLLESTLGAASGPPAVRAWAETIAGELATRLADDPAAEQHFRAALALVANDPYTLGAYADLLLDTGRPDAAATLLAEHSRHDALLLRYVIARERSGRPVAEARRDLEARMAAARRRGDDVHLREAARFALSVQGDPARAVATARANWAVQREPADLLVLAEAAQASGDRAALGVVRAWLRDTGLEDRRIEALLRGGA